MLCNCLMTETYTENFFSGKIVVQKCLHPSGFRRKSGTRGKNNCIILCNIPDANCIVSNDIHSVSVNLFKQMKQIESKRIVIIEEKNFHLKGKRKEANKSIPSCIEVKFNQIPNICIIFNLFVALSKLI